MAFRSFPSTLPSVHPFAVVVVLVVDKHGCIGIYYSLFRCEKLIRRIDYARAQPRLLELYPVTKWMCLIHVESPGAAKRIRAIL